MLCVAVSLWTGQAHSQILTLTDPGLPHTRASAAAWGDVDNDGDLDLALAGLDNAGQAFTKIFENIAGVLTENTDHQITGILWGDLDWRDFNNDGFPDLAISGQGQNGTDVFGVSEVYLNVNGVLIQDLTQLSAPPPFTTTKELRYSSVAWADYTNDGKQDLLIAGMDLNGFVFTKLYTNQSNNLSESSSQTVVAIRNGSVDWGDFDGDGVPDLAAMGLDANGLQSTKVFKNQNGLLIESSTISLPQLSLGDVAWGDYDQDSNLDLAISGWDGDWNAVLKVYRNDALRGTLEEAATLTVGGQGVVGDIAWGDYDNDGDLDLAIAGRDEFTSISTTVFVNTGGVFAAAIEPSLIGALNGTVTWGDVNGDAKLDLLVTGEKADGTLLTALYTNSGAANTAPTAPTLAKPFITSKGIEFRWAPGSDAETSTNMLTYNLRLGTTSGGGDVVAAASVGQPGNVGQTLVKEFEFPVVIDTLFWSVQTVDAGLAQSVFTTEDTIQVQRLVSSNHAITGVRQDVLGRGAAWGDYTGDGFVDLVVAGRDINGDTQTILYHNESGSFTRDEMSSITGLQNGALAWGDYDNDGDLDLFRSGGDRFGNEFTFLYKNTNSVFQIDSTQTEILNNLNLKESSAAWGDYNNDGLLDLAINGKDRSGAFQTFLYRNMGSDRLLIRDTDQSLTATVNGDLAWGDIDNDGDPDLIISGQIAVAPSLVLEVYRNVSGLLVEDQSLTVYLSSAIALADYDDDGDLDLAVNGGKGATVTPTLTLFSNDGTGTFTEDQTFAGAFGGSTAWGDYDNDGDYDLVMSGQDGNNEVITRIFRNDSGTLVETIMSVLPGLVFSTTPWADYDNDGDLDLAMTGGVGVNFTESSGIFDNLTDQTSPNTVPSAPVSLAAVPFDSSVILTWNDGSDAETSANSLTYSVRVGTTPGGNDIVSGVHPIAIGERGHANVDTLKSLSDSTYYWAVQSIDAGLAVSNETSEREFIIDTTAPVVASVSADPAIAGIGATVTLVIVFDEKVGIANATAPTVTFTPRQGGTAVAIEQLAFNGAIWTGKVTIGTSVPTDTMLIAVSGVQDLQGNTMTPVTDAGTFQVDSDIPAVVNTVPEAGQIGVVSTTIPKAVFSKDINTSNIDEVFILRRSDTGATVEGGAFFDAATKTMEFRPSTRLAGDTQYEVTATASISDEVGNLLGADFRWSFTTATQLSSNDGGRLQSVSGDVMLYIPPKSIGEGQEIGLETIDSDSIAVASPRFTTKQNQTITFVGPAFRFTPEETILDPDKPGTLTMKYGTLASGINENSLAIFRESSTGIWERLGGTVKASSQTVTTTISQLGKYALFEDTNASASGLPLSNFRAQPRVFSPKGNRFNTSETAISFVLGQSFPVTVEVYNMAGRLERVICNNLTMGPGNMVEFWDGKNNNGKICTSGLYIVIIDAGGNNDRITVSVLNDS